MNSTEFAIHLTHDKKKLINKNNNMITILKKTFTIILLFLFVIIESQYAQVHRCNDFIESIGVATHFNYSDLPYVKRYNEVKEILGASGIRYIRDGAAVANFDIKGSTNRVYQLYEDFGIKCIVVFGQKYYTHDHITSRLDTLAKTSDFILAFEGPNEPDLNKTGYNMPDNWTDILRVEQEYILNQVRNHSDSAIRSKPVLSPSHTFPQRVSWMGEMKSLSDYYNIHSYHGGINPEYPFSNFVNYLNEIPKVNNDPDFLSRTWATEAGYHNELDLTLSKNGCTPEVEGKYLNRMFLWYYKHGIKRTFTYSLLDWQTSKNLKRFGLIDLDLKPKPAYNALKNFISILNDTTSNFNPTNINYTLENKSTATYDMLFQHSNGDYFLALWQGEIGWSPELQKVINVNPRKVKLTLPGVATEISVFNPLISGDSIVSFLNTGTLEINVPDEVIILRIKGLNVVNNQQIINGISISVNYIPNKKTLKISGIESDFSYSIFNASGSIMKRASNYSNSELNLSNLNAGVYFINIVERQNSVTKKFIIQ